MAVIYILCLGVENLAKKQFSFKVFFIAAWSLFSNNSIHSRYLFVMPCIVRFNHNYVEP